MQRYRLQHDLILDTFQFLIPMSYARVCIFFCAIDTFKKVHFSSFFNNKCFVSNLYACELVFFKDAQLTELTHNLGSLYLLNI